MILQLDMENNYSINNNQRVAFIADAKSEHEEALISFGKYKIVPALGIYGKNASGKTNVIKGFEHVRDMIIESHSFNPTRSIPFYTPFKFIEEKDRDSKFEIMFVSNEKRYIYGFSHNSKRVSEEYLYIFKTVKPTKIFERKEKEYSFGNEYEELEYLKERTHDNKLFLSVASQWAANVVEINDIYSYFENDIICCKNSCNELSPEFFNKTTDLLVENEEARNFLKKIIKYFDLEMTEIRADKTLLELDKIPPEVAEILKKIRNPQENSGEQEVLFGSRIMSTYSIDGIEYQLNIQEESNGIQKLYDLFSILFTSLTSKKFVIIDEIEMGLHPILSKELIRLFQDREINVHGSQLLFTTHDTNILDLSLLRRDQIWFTSKSLENRYSTEVYSLSDVNGVRMKDNISKDYLNGRYTEIPKIPQWRDV